VSVVSHPDCGRPRRVEPDGLPGARAGSVHRHTGRRGASSAPANSFDRPAHGDSTSSACEYVESPVHSRRSAGRSWRRTCPQRWPRWSKPPHVFLNHH